MSRHFVLIALAILVTLPLTAQTTQKCTLQISVTCNPSSNGSQACTSTTINAGTTVCSGQFFSAYYAVGNGKVTGMTNSLGLNDCFDSSAFPQQGVSYDFCFGIASLAPGAQFTASANIGAGATQILGLSGVFDTNFDTQAVVVAEANVKTLTCTPTVSAPPVTQSGLDYAVVWTTVSDPTAQFSVEESASPDFSTLISKTQVNSVTKTFNHDVGSTTTTFYYRVQATNCNGTAGPYSAPTQVIVQAQAPATSKNPEVTVPLGTTQPVSIKVFIPGSASGGKSADRHALGDPTFTATTDKPYLTVTPSTGTIPPEGTTVTVTATPGSLPAGANTGTLKVTSNGTTSNTPVSINLVTPVAPTTLATPPPNALIIPVVTHVNAAAGPFLSDVRVTNAGSLPVTYQVTMSSTVNSVVTSKATVVTVGSQETTALNDIVKNFFGLGATGASTDVGFGALEIHPVDSGSLLTFAASRTYASLSNGTLGQFIAAVPFSKFATKMQSPIVIPGAPTGASITRLSLQQVSQSARFRTNFGLAEGAGQPASGVIHIFDAAGNNLKDVPFSLQAGEQKQFNGFISASGIPTLTDGRIELEITSPTGAVTAYASVLDNQTTDPLAVTPVDVSSVASTRYVVPGIAELNNGPSTNFHSDVRLFNGGASDVVANLTFYPQAGLPGAASAKSLLIHRGEVAVLDNILPTLFNVSGSGGSVVVTTPSSSSLVATARTYTVNATNGTYGQFIPGVTPAEGIGNGDRPLQVLQLEQSDRFRSNLGLVELTGNPVTVEVSLYTPDSKTTPSFPVTLAANEFRQLGGVIATFLGTGTQTYNARVSIKVIDGNGRVSAYGSVIDNQSADPTYVPAQ